MNFSRMGVIAVAMVALAGAGCSSTRFSSDRPEPLRPAPAGIVTGSQLPPPTQPGSFPPAPGAETNIASLPAEPPATALDLTASKVAGVWSASVSGQGCKVATPQTKYGSGYRAGPLRCPAPLDGVKSWNVSGKQLTFYDESGGTLARLYSSGPERFDGQTETGIPISLSR